MSELWREAGSRLGGVDAIDLARELVERLSCPACGWSAFAGKPAELLREDEVLCPACKTECVPQFVHSLTAGSELLKKTAREIGLPRWEIVWARRGPDCVGLELAGDNPWNPPAGTASQER